MAVATFGFVGAVLLALMGVACILSAAIPKWDPGGGNQGDGLGRLATGAGLMLAALTLAAWSFA